jgi:hypothetical protein
MVGYPSLYQINTRVWLRQLSDRLGRAADLGLGYVTSSQLTPAKVPKYNTPKAAVIPLN